MREGARHDAGGGWRGLHVAAPKRHRRHPHARPRSPAPSARAALAARVEGHVVRRALPPLRDLLRERAPRAVSQPQLPVPPRAARVKRAGAADEAGEVSARGHRHDPRAAEMLHLASPSGAAGQVRGGDRWVRRVG